MKGLVVNTHRQDTLETMKKTVMSGNSATDYYPMKHKRKEQVHQI
jgi:hypothetical protein